MWRRHFPLGFRVSPGSGGRTNHPECRLHETPRPAGPCPRAEGRVPSRGLCSAFQAGSGHSPVASSSSLPCGVATAAAALDPPPPQGPELGTGREPGRLLAGAARPRSHAPTHPESSRGVSSPPFPGRLVGARSVRPGRATRGETEARVSRGERERCARCREPGRDARGAVLISVREEKRVAHTDLMKGSSREDGVLPRRHGDAGPRSAAREPAGCLDIRGVGGCSLAGSATVRWTAALRRRA